MNVYLIFLTGLPNAHDRLDIINFYLRKSRESGRLASDVSMDNLKQLVSATENFSGADLSQIVQIASIEVQRRLLKVSVFDYSIFINIMLVIIGTHHAPRKT